jgi:hypothetical protein
MHGLCPRHFHESAEHIRADVFPILPWLSTHKPHRFCRNARRRSFTKKARLATPFGNVMWIVSVPSNYFARFSHCACARHSGFRNSLPSILNLRGHDVKNWPSSQYTLYTLIHTNSSIITVILWFYAEQYKWYDTRWECTQKHPVIICFYRA